MKCAAFVMLLTFALQTAPSRQALSKGNDPHSADHQNSSEGKQQPPQSVRPDPASRQQQGVKEDSKAQKDDRTLLWAGIIVNTVLAVATIVLAIFAIVQAAAAKASAQVLLESQRPHVAADAKGSPTKDLSDQASPRVQIALVNRGATTAYDCIYESWIELLAFPFNDFTASADYFKAADRFALYPNHAPVVINIPIRKGLTGAQLSDLKQLRLYACIRIRIAYRDAFSPGRYANFGFYVLHDGLGFLPKYNDAN
jgi:hypothetical protein